MRGRQVTCLSTAASPSQRSNHHAVTVALRAPPASLDERRDPPIGTEVPTRKLRHEASCRIANHSARGSVSRSPRCCHLGCAHCTRLPAPTRPPTSRIQQPLRPPPSTLSVGYADNLESFPARSPDVQRRMEVATFHSWSGVSSFTSFARSNGSGVAARTRLPRARPSRESTRVHPVRTRGASSAWDRNHTAMARHRSSPEGTATVPRPVRNGARQTSDIEVVFSVLTVLPPSRRTRCQPGDIGEPDTTHRRLQRAETHFHQRTRDERRTTTSRRTNRNLAAPDRTRPNPAPTCAQPRRCYHHRASPHVCRTSTWICSNHQTSFDARVSPKTDGAPKSDRPEGWRFPEIGLFWSSPMTLGCLTSGIRMDGLSGAQRGTRRTLSTSAALRTTS
jgi:hypothetical protein